MPAGLMSCALAMREGRLRQTAAIGGAQVVFANMATAVLALTMGGPLALIVPRVIAAPVWLIGMRRLRP
jgi:PST family polysaccharide transporter